MRRMGQRQGGCQEVRQAIFFGVWLLGAILLGACRSTSASVPGSMPGGPASNGPGTGASASDTPFKPLSLQDFSAAVAVVKSLAGMSGPDEVGTMLRELADPRLSSLRGAALARWVFDDQEMHKYGGQLRDFLGLAALAFSARDPAFVQAQQERFDQATAQVERMRAQLTAYFQTLHPGYAALNASRLRARRGGAGIKIAVFDLFDRELLAKQKKHYTDATIEEVQTFGDPVAMDHGNSVLDVLLGLAPKAVVVPITADQAHYTQALQWLAARPDLAIINMSRAFLQDQRGGLDTAFAAGLDILTQSKIVIKALGNTGTDLDDILTPLRAERHLGPVASLFAYDTRLIRLWLKSLGGPPQRHPLLLFAVNLAPLATRVARTATIPGQNHAAVEMTLATPADGVFSFATGNFESGSSFAAPMLAALSALLLAEDQALRPNAVAGDARRRVYDCLRRTARRGHLAPSDVGQGIPQGDAALQALASPLAPNAWIQR